jgi:hypothetical protein
VEERKKGTATAEVQRIETFVSGHSEVQAVASVSSERDEVQVLRSSVAYVNEVQTIELVNERRNEMQRITTDLAHVEEIQVVETVSQSYQPEIQLVEINALVADVSGSFRVGFGSAFTPDLPYNVGATAFRDAVAALLGGDPDGVEVERSDKLWHGGYKWLVIFLREVDFPLLVADDAKLTGALDRKSVV